MDDTAAVTKGTARARPPARSLGDQALAPFAAAIHAGNKGWPLAFHSCLATLQLLRWQLATAHWLKRDVPVALDAVAECPERSVEGRGLTHLVDAAIALLGQVHMRGWRSGAEWPAKGDWSSRLQNAHTPEALQAAVELAATRVVIWPGAKYCGVHLRLSGGIGPCTELSLPPSNSTLLDVVCCFICGHAADVAHPRIHQLVVCGVCLERFNKPGWTCDEELLGYRCDGCAHRGTAPPRLQVLWRQPV